MKALVYHGPGKKAWEEVPEPKLREPGDAIVRVDTTTICGTDLHILKGDVPAVTDGRILGHEGVGTVVSPALPAGLDLRFLEQAVPAADLPAPTHTPSTPAAVCDDVNDSSAVG